ncbi:hypothetical protein H0H93_009447 [Arthromyces matolae]|nr:hypothetical protein H0H93_009447 [Arthromyces matolae]
MSTNSPVAVIDNGASTIKVGIASSVDDTPRIIPNAVIRSKGDKMTYFGHELDKCKDYSSLNYRLPFEKGYLVDWDAQKAVWDGVFSSEVLSIDSTESKLLITEPYLNLPLPDKLKSPITEAYRSAVAFSRIPDFTNRAVTRAEYAESGSNASRRKFHDWKPREAEKEKPRELAKAKGKQREDDRSQAPSKLASRTRTKSNPTSTAATRRR